MRRQLFEDGHWEKHGDYWILHKSGTPVALLIQIAELKPREVLRDKNTDWGEEINRHERFTSTLRCIGD